MEKRPTAAILASGKGRPGNFVSPLSLGTCSKGGRGPGPAEMTFDSEFFRELLSARPAAGMHSILILRRLFPWPTLQTGLQGPCMPCGEKKNSEYAVSLLDFPGGTIGEKPPRRFELPCAWWRPPIYVSQKTKLGNGPRGPTVFGPRDQGGGERALRNRKTRRKTETGFGRGEIFFRHPSRKHFRLRCPLTILNGRGAFFFFIQTSPQSLKGLLGWGYEPQGIVRPGPRRRFLGLVGIPRILAGEWQTGPVFQARHWENPGDGPSPTEFPVCPFCPGDGFRGWPTLEKRWAQKSAGWTRENWPGRSFSIPRGNISGS